jgi:hypothetical protein
MNDMKAILWLAVEDYSGLWEAVWQLRSLHPEFHKDVLTEQASSAVSNLLGRGLIRLYRCQEPDGKLSLVRSPEDSKLLESPQNWEEPTRGATSIRFGATPAGEAAYESWTTSYDESV